MITLERLLELRSADAWEKGIQETITFLITETPTDTFEARAAELQQMLASLEELRKFFSNQPPTLTGITNKN